jgi:hypothetical protein
MIERACRPSRVFDGGMKHFALEDPDGLRLDFFQGRDGYEAFIAGNSQAIREFRDPESGDGAVFSTATATRARFAPLAAARALPHV